MNARTGIDVIGSVLELWRYPVSSIGGERIAAGQVDERGLLGDRQFALIDAENGFAAAPEMDKRWRKALHLNASYTGAGTATISFPNGTVLAVTDRQLNEALSDYFCFAVAIATLTQDDQFSQFPVTNHRHHHAAVHLITTTSIEHLSRLVGGETLSSVRFRPTAVIATTEQNRFLEDEWIGKKVFFGAVSLVAEERTKRCGMTIVSQPGMKEEPEILRNILRHNQRNFGVNCAVTVPGRLSVGDALTIQR